MFVIASLDPSIAAFSPGCRLTYRSCLVNAQIMYTVLSPQENCSEVDKNKVDKNEVGQTCILPTPTCTCK